MAIYLPSEVETEVYGANGLICIKQTINGKERAVWLTIHQFSTIFNHEKHLVREALGTE